VVLDELTLAHLDFGGRGSCGYAVPFQRFAREDDGSSSAYFEKKEHIATSLDGLPGLPLPLPPSTV
jgi:hypothetical protein